MRKLILVRHSNSKLDPDIPPHEWGLTDHGAARCIPLAEILSKHKPGIIITSVEPKARQTGEIIAKTLGTPCLTAANLHEHEREVGGILSKDAFCALIADLFAIPDVLIFGLETARDALDRFSEAVGSVMADYPGRNVAIVTHGTVMSLYYGSISGDNSFNFWRQLGLPSFYTVSWPECVVLSTIMNI